MPLVQYDDGDWACLVCAEPLGEPPYLPSTGHGAISASGAMGLICDGCGIEWGAREGFADPGAPPVPAKMMYARLRIRWLNQHHWTQSQLDRLREVLGISRAAIEEDLSWWLAKGTAARWSGPLGAARSFPGFDSTRPFPDRGARSADLRPVAKVPIRFLNGEAGEIVVVARNSKYGDREHRCFVCGHPRRNPPYWPGSAAGGVALPDFGEYCYDCALQIGIDDACPPDAPPNHMRDLFREFRIRWLARIAWREDAVLQLERSFGVTKDQLLADQEQMLASGRLRP